MAEVVVNDLVKVFTTPTGPQTVINGIDFTIADQSFVSLVGPSGCGKTTLLNIIAGIESASGGSVTIGSSHRPGKLAYVFQEPRLLPWRSIFDNLMYVQRERDDAAKARVHEALRRVGLGHAEKKVSDRGVPYFDSVLSERAQLWTWRCWADWMNADDWASLRENKSELPDRL